MKRDFKPFDRTCCSVTLCIVCSTVRIVLCPRSDRRSAHRPSVRLVHFVVLMFLLPLSRLSTLDSRLSSIASLSQTPAKDTCRRITLLPAFTAPNLSSYFTFPSFSFILWVRPSAASEYHSTGVGGLPGISIFRRY